MLCATLTRPNDSRRSFNALFHKERRTPTASRTNLDGLEGDAYEVEVDQGRGDCIMQTMSTKLLIAIGALLSVAVGAAAYLFAAGASSQIEARAEILVPLSTDFAANSTNVQTQIALISSTSVLQSAARHADISLQALSSALQVKQEGGSQMIELTVNAQSGPVAVRSARAVISAYDEIVATQAGNSDAEVYLQDEIAKLQTQLSKAPRSGSSSSSSEASTTRTLMLARISALQDQLVSAQLAALGSGQPAEIVTAPYVVPNVGQSNSKLAALAGFVGTAVICAFALRKRLLAGRLSLDGKTKTAKADA